MKTVLLDLDKIMEINVTEDTQFVILSDAEIPNEEISLNLLFKKQGVSAEVIGIFNIEKNKGTKLVTSSKHIVPNTSCETFIKAVLNDGSIFDYQGKIIIEKDAQNTTAYLNDNVLVVGENTKRNSQPILEIDANDVKASHGSTTGRISEEELYYLESRGLSTEQAKKLIKEGFLTDLVGKIKDKEAREKVLDKIKFNGGDL